MLQLWYALVTLVNLVIAVHAAPTSTPNDLESRAPSVSKSDCPFST